MKTASSLRMAVTSLLLVLVITSLFTAGCFDIPTRGSGSSFRAGTTGDLRAYFLDVGQGDSSVILFKDKVILIDAGEIDQGDRVVSDLTKLGVTRIDLLVATHPHSDHIGGMQSVLAAFPVGMVIDSGMPASSSPYEHFLGTLDKKDIPYLVAEQGQILDIDPALRILVLSPPKNRIGDDLNTNSIVLRISYGSVNLLYTGDATNAAEDTMEKAVFPLDAQILKVGHHGSSSSSSAAFLSRVRPELAVISLGKDNPYGHPHRETLERLQDTSFAIYRTDHDGTILIRSDGVTYSVMTEEEGGNIWAPPTSAPTTAGTTAPSPSPSLSNPVITSLQQTITGTLHIIPPEISFSVPSVPLPSPVQIGNASSVYISAVRFDAPGDDRQNLNGEWVCLTNGGNDIVLLAGWTLSDRSSTEPYTFPAVVLLPGTSVTVYTGNGMMNDSSLYMGRNEPVWGNSGDIAFLRDGSGIIVDRSPEGGSV